MSDTFVRPDILAGSSQGGTGDGNDYVKPLLERPVGEVVALADRWFDRSVANRQHVENKTLLNLAFHLGQQYVRIDSSNAYQTRVVPVEKKRGQVRTVDNLVDPAVRQETARLLRTRPFGTVIPQGDDPADHEAAKAATDALEHVKREGGWEEALEEAVRWSLFGGTGVLGTAWEDGKSDSFGQKGMVNYRALSPFEFAVPHLRRSDIDDQPYVMVTKAFEVDEIEARWGIRVAPDREEQFGSYDERLMSVITGQGRERGRFTGGNKGHEERIPVAVTKEIWIRPGPMAPEGGVLIVASGQILEFKEKWPDWCNGQYPFSKVTYNTIPGAFWGKPMVDDLIPLQRRHNRAASVLVETLGLVSHTTVAATRGTKVKSILGGRGTMLETPPGAGSPASQLRVSNVGNLPIAELEQTRQAVRDNAFFHEVSRGTTPPNVRSGTAIVSLKELDDAPSSIPLRSIERATQRMGRFSLNLIKQKWETKRMVMVLGEENDVERRSFVDSDSIGGQYWVQPGSAWPITKGQRQQMVLELFQNGLISPEEALMHLEVGTPQSIKNDRYRDVRHARREHQKIERLTQLDPQTGQVTQQSMQRLVTQAEQVFPKEWHDHATHLREHNNLRKSPVYEKWEPWRKQIFEAHIAGHRVALEQQLMAQMQGPGGGLREQAAGQQAERQNRMAAAQQASERMDKIREQQMRAAEVAAQQQAAQQQQSGGE